MNKKRKHLKKSIQTILIYLVFISISLIAILEFKELKTDIVFKSVNITIALISTYLLYNYGDIKE